MKILRSIVIVALTLFPALSLSAALDSRADLLLGRADSLLHSGLYKEAIEMGQEAEEAALAADDASTLIKSWCVLGEAYLRLGDPDTAEEYYRRCINLPEAEMDVSNICNALLHVAQSYHAIGDFETAETYTTLSLDICVGLDGRPGNTALRYLELGTLYVDMGKLDLALETFEKGIAIVRAVSNHVVTARLLIGRGSCLEQMDRVDEALASYRDAIKELNMSSNGGGRFKASCNYHIANILHSQGDDEEARIYYLRALGHKNWIQDHETQMHLYRDYAEFLGPRDSVLSRTYAAKADSLSYVTYLNEFGSRMAVNSLQILLQDKDELITTKDQLLLFQHRRQVMLILLILALLIILIGAIMIIRQTNSVNAELQRKDFVKNRMFSVISHDLRAPAIARRTALHMLADNPSSLSSEDFQRICSDLAFQSDTEIVMLENLLQWARFQSMNPDSVPAIRFDVVDAVQEATSQLFQYAGQKSIKIESHSSGESIFLYSNRNMLIIVVRNLLANAVKFSHRGSAIAIEMNELTDGAEVIVCDEGVGMPSDLVKAINSNLSPGTHRLGTENETGTGMGLSLCQEVLRLCKGSLRVESEEGKGSKFIVDIKNR